MANIVLYSSAGCSYCQRMKTEFEQWGLDFEERNVTENPDYMEDLNKEGIFSTPVVYIDGEQFIGYRPNQMKEKLGIE